MDQQAVDDILYITGKRRYWQGSRQAVISILHETDLHVGQLWLATLEQVHQRAKPFLPHTYWQMTLTSGETLLYSSRKRALKDLERITRKTIVIYPEQKPTPMTWEIRIDRGKDTWYCRLGAMVLAEYDLLYYYGVGMLVGASWAERCEPWQVEGVFEKNIKEMTQGLVEVKF